MMVEKRLLIYPYCCLQYKGVHASNNEIYQGSILFASFVGMTVHWIGHHYAHSLGKIQLAPPIHSSQQQHPEWLRLPICRIWRLSQTCRLLLHVNSPNESIQLINKISSAESYSSHWVKAIFYKVYNRSIFYLNLKT